MLDLPALPLVLTRLRFQAVVVEDSEELHQLPQQKTEVNAPPLLRVPPGRPEKPLSLVANVLGVFQPVIDFIFPPATDEPPR